ncbi:hypothetical protein [Pararhodonellum marinum]|uniref:hypothetical protein n=1 Tax=Pararhodonellum marinum TaxID=2755358 RepID=UPI00188E7ABC|nr:hypothetical protein [Pararhodonellum marinum]
MGQTFEKVSFNEHDEKDYYLLLRPLSEDINGVLVLMPGYGQDPESIFPESKLFNVAYANGIVTMAIAGGQKLYADEEVVDKLNRGLSDLLSKNPTLDKTKFVMGGFSAGGTISLRFVEHCMANPSAYPIIPQGVFSVDSPIDLFDIWDYFQREMEKNFSQAGVFEAEFVTEIMTNEIGTPETNEARYNELTPFRSKQKELGNAQFLKEVAVRVYHDLDVEWQLKERRRSLYDTNQLTASELINRLLLNGNDKAEFMTARSPGYRSSGLRHPHSWSIVDEVEFIQWTLGLLAE